MADVIKEFLVAVGFQVDQTSAKQVQKSITDEEALIKRLVVQYQNMNKGISETEARRKVVARLHENRLKEQQRLEQQAAHTTVQTEQQRVEATERGSRRIVSHLDREARAYNQLGHTVSNVSRNIVLSVGSMIAGLAVNFGFLSNRLEDLHNLSVKTGATATNIRALERTFQMLGGSKQDARGVIEGISSAMKSNRGVGAVLRSWGINATDPVEIVRQLVPMLSRMESDTAIRFGGLVGVGPETVGTMRRPGFLNEFEKAQESMRLWGSRTDDVARRTKALNDEWRELLFSLEEANVAFWEGFIGKDGQTALGSFNKMIKDAAPEIGRMARAFGEWALTKGKSLMEWFGDEKNRERLVKYLTDVGDALIKIADALTKLVRLLSFNVFPDWVNRLIGGIPKPDWGGGGVSSTPGVTERRGANEAARSGDTRNFWQRIAPKFLGGKDAPTGDVSGVREGRGRAGRWWTPDRVNYAVNYLKENAGLPEVSAQALVARWAGVEAAQGPGAVNPMSGAAGIAQWLGPRKRSGIPPSFEGQLGKVVRELKGDPSEGSNEARAYKMLLNAKTPQEAAVGASQFERAEGYNQRTGADNFVGQTLGTMRSLGFFARKAIEQASGAAAAGDGSKGFDPSRFDMIKGATPLGTSPVSNDNSRKIDFNATYHTSIMASDAKSAAPQYQSLHEGLSGLAARQLSGAVR